MHMNEAGKCDNMVKVWNDGYAVLPGKPKRGTGRDHMQF